MSPVKLINTPGWDQLLSHSWRPLERAALQKVEALTNSSTFKSPRRLMPFYSKKNSSMRCFWIHWTHNDDLDERIHQINFRQETLLTSSRDLNHNPPSSFGEHTSDQAIFAFCVDITGSDHRRVEHRLFISWIHFSGRRKADVQKFIRL